MNCTFTWNKRRLFDQRACVAIMAKIMENPLAKVLKVNNRRTSKYRPHPMDTVTFERLASSKLKINAKRAMIAAERLYNLGFISYPRTETNKFPPEIKLNDLIQAQCDNQQWGQYANRILERGGANPRNGNFVHCYISIIIHTIHFFLLFLAMKFFFLKKMIFSINPLMMSMPFFCLFFCYHIIALRLVRSTFKRKQIGSSSPTHSSDKAGNQSDRW